VALTKEKKQELVSNFHLHDKDNGSVEVQVAMLTERVNYLTGHFKMHPKDHHSNMGLLRMVGKRRRLLNYLRNSDPKAYQALIETLSLRK
jgi:small subunit ribosomal protein S15